MTPTLFIVNLNLLDFLIDHMDFRFFNKSISLHKPLSITTIPSRENREIYYHLTSPSVNHIEQLSGDYKFVLSNSIDEHKLLSLLATCEFNLTLRDFQYTLNLCIPNGIHIIEHVPSGCYASSMMSRHLSLPNFHPAGNIGWLSTAPKFRGLGLGYNVAVAATNHLIAHDYTNIWVSTHLHRIGALKIFKRLGFEQFYPF